MSGDYPVSYYYYSGCPAPVNGMLEAGKTGAVLGLCGGAAASLHRLRRDEVSRQEAAMATLRAGAASGLAAAAASLVASQFRSPALSLAATVAAGTAVMYAITARDHTAQESSHES
jgi:hypothetical protein